MVLCNIAPLSLLLKLILLGFTFVSMTSAATAPSSASQTGAKAVRHARLPLHPRQPAVSPSVRATAAPRLYGHNISVFNGLNKQALSASDNSFFNNGSPPDTTGAIGPNYYVETVNSIIGVYNRSNLTLVVSRTLQQWLGKAPSAPVCDPQIEWDASSQRWLYVVLGCSFGLDAFNFGWSKTSDPSNFANGWCRFSRGTPGYLSDYPKLGHNNNYMIVGTNDFSDLLGNAFLTSEIFWMAKPASEKDPRSQAIPCQPLVLRA